MIPLLPNPHDNLTPDQISSFQRYFTIENVISDEQCNDLIEYGNQFAVEATDKHLYGKLLKLDHCFLEADHYLHTILQPAWEQAQKFFNFEINFIEPYELKRYSEGGYFNTHIDNYHGLNLPMDRKISMSIQLSNDSDYNDGNLIINPKKIMPRKKGTAIFFPSFYPHRVDSVTAGIRWSVISWAWGPYWK